VKHVNHSKTTKGKAFSTTSIGVVSSKEEVITLTPEQLIMLQMSEEDIKNGDLLSQDELDLLNNKWLLGK
jgi:hypothetical protein